VPTLRGRGRLESAPPFRDTWAKPRVAFCEELGATRWITEGSFLVAPDDTFELPQARELETRVSGLARSSGGCGDGTLSHTVVIVQ
jgi:hypothetical protein